MKPARSTHRTLEVTATAHVNGIPWRAQVCCRLCPRTLDPVCTDIGSFVCFLYGAPIKVARPDVDLGVIVELQDAACAEYLRVTEADGVDVEVGR